ncbi:MAG: (Fe-S)-binding protein [Nitriliruptorales bacterium]|nr:(Fe-S)-binding protein [Nitriliruptorales bacterium]
MRRTALFPTCVIDTVAGDVGMAVVRVLRSRGHDVDVPDDATCCGQPGWNAGHVDEAAAVAKQTLGALATTTEDTICVPAGSCATMIRVYWPVLFRLVNDEESAVAAEGLRDRVREFSELLSEDDKAMLPEDDQATGTTPGPTAAVAATAYHHSCHMLRELGIETQPEQALQAAGIEPVEWDGERQCCGFGGTFAVKQPELSTAMADEKLEALEELEVEQVVGCDTSCLLHLRGRAERRGMQLRFRHLAEVLDPT